MVTAVRSKPLLQRLPRESRRIGALLHAAFEARANGSAVCDGDSGGPATFDRDGRTLVAGVLSMSEAYEANPRCSRPGGLQVWTRRRISAVLGENVASGRDLSLNVTRPAEGEGSGIDARRPVRPGRGRASDDPEGSAAEPLADCSGVVETAITAALKLAAKAQRWDIVVGLAMVILGRQRPARKRRLICEMAAGVDRARGSPATPIGTNVCMR